MQRHRDSPVETSPAPTVRRQWWSAVRRLFRFNLQSLLLLVVAAAFGFSWWREHLRYAELAQKQNSAGPNWSVDQVTGAPNTPGAGDITTAWASQSQDGGVEWLLLEYKSRVEPHAVVVHETYNPGAVVRVTAFDLWGNEQEIWRGTDPTPPTAPRGVSVLKVDKPPFATRWIKLHVDSAAVRGWNEIDAVGVRDAAGNVQWARRAYASSAYGANHAAPGWYARLAGQ